MTWLDFTVLILAASGLVDVWMNGGIFAEWRALFQDKADAEPPSVEAVAADDDEGDDGEELSFAMRLADRIVPKWMASLFSCPFCLSHYTPWVLALLCFFPALLVEATWLAFLLKLPVYSLAATRAGNIINALMPEEDKYE